MGLQYWWVSSHRTIGRGVDCRTSWESYGKQGWLIGRRSARTEDNVVSSVEELVLSKEGQPQTHRSIRQISREISVPKSSVLRIVHDTSVSNAWRIDVRKSSLNQIRAVRLQCAKKLLQMFLDDKVDFIWFTYEKVFTVSSPRNPQNDRLYVPAGIKKKQVASERLLRTRTTFSRSVMVSVGVSKLGLTDLIVKVLDAHQYFRCLI